MRKKAKMAEIGSETGRSGATLFLAYVFGKGYWGILWLTTSARGF